MMYLFALAVAASIGFLTIRLLVHRQLSFYLNLFLGIALGLGIAEQIIFYIQLLGNNFNHFLPPLLSLILLGILIWLNKPIQLSSTTIPKNLSLLILPILAVPLWMEAHFFPLGGWDAWSCWNLKAKFIYLGENHWKDMLASNLWRSNTGYPLALPCINVWFWHWTGFAQYVPMFNAILLTLVTAGTLLLGLQELKVSVFCSIIITLSLFTLSLGNTLSISQYSDMLFSLYLLAALVNYLLYEYKKDQGFLFLSALFIALLSFSKNEGLGASAMLALLITLRKPADLKVFTLTLVLASLPTVIFTFSMAPKSQAFINGILSADKPSTWTRFQSILIYPYFEMIGTQWGGLWIAALAALALGWKKTFKNPYLIIGQFIAGYLCIVFAYYYINTFFEIGWWMNNTFNRIIFALMPTVFLWMGIGLFQTKKDA